MMLGLLPAIAGGLARALLAFAAGHGVDLGSDQADAIVQGLLALVAVAWTVVNKLSADQRVKQAASTGLVP